MSDRPYAPPPAAAPPLHGASTYAPHPGHGGHPGAVQPASLYRHNVFVPPGQMQGPPPTPWLRRLKLVLGGMGMLGVVSAVTLLVTAAGKHPDALLTGFAVLGLSYLLLLGHGILNLVWVHRLWSWIPPEQRYTRHWQKYVSPGAAAGFLLIPYFNIYWMFVLYPGICDVLERMAVAHPGRLESPRKLALARVIVPMVLFPAGPLLDFLFDRRVEAMIATLRPRLPGMLPQPVPWTAPGHLGGPR